MANISDIADITLALNNIVSHGLLIADVAKHVETICVALYAKCYCDHVAPFLSAKNYDELETRFFELVDANKWLTIVRNDKRIYDILCEKKEGTSRPTELSILRRMMILSGKITWEQARSWSEWMSFLESNFMPQIIFTQEMLEHIKFP
jgi:hypothetical protein